MDLILSFRFFSPVLIVLMLGACSRGDLATVPTPQVNPDIDCSVDSVVSSLISELRVYSKGKDGRRVSSYFDDRNIALTFQGRVLSVEQGVSSLFLFADFADIGDELLLENGFSARLSNLALEVVGEKGLVPVTIEDAVEAELLLMEGESAARIDVSLVYAYEEERDGCKLLGAEKTNEVIDSDGNTTEETFVERTIKEEFSIRFELMRSAPINEIVESYYDTPPGTPVNFGSSVSFNGGFFVYGVPGYNSGRGVVFLCEAQSVFDQDLSSCTQILASNAQAGDAFGSTVLLRNNRLFVSAPGEDSNYSGAFNGLASSLTLAYTKPSSGAVYEFTVSSAGVAQEVAYIKNPDNSANGTADVFDAKFGAVLAEYNGDIFIGAPDQKVVDGSSSDKVGAVYQFFYAETSDGSLNRGAFNKISSDVEHDRQGFGSSIAVSEDYLLIGAPRDGSRPSDLPVFDGFVDATYISSNTITDVLDDSGSATLMERPVQGGLFETLAYLKPENLDERDQFGASVSIVDNSIFVGAPRDDSSSSQVNVGLYDNTLSNSGAVYRYVIEEVEGIGLVDFVKSRQPMANANFGEVLDAETRYLVVANNSVFIDFEDFTSTQTHAEIINYETYEDSTFVSVFEDVSTDSVFSAEVESIEFYGGMVSFGLPQATVDGISNAGAFALWR